MISRRLLVVVGALAGVLAGTGRAWPQSRPPAIVSLAASTYRVNQWTTADGLPQNSVLDVAILDSGQMWLATFGGLVSFDGVRFDVVDMAVDRSLPSHRIVAVEPGGPDALWFVTQGGHLGRFEGGRTVSTVMPPTASEDALGLAPDGTGQWLAKLRDGTLWRSDGRSPWSAVPGPALRAVPHLSLSSGRPGAAVVWEKRLLSWTPRGFIDETVLPRDRMNVFSGGDDRLWLAAGTSLMRYQDGRLEDLSIAPPFTTEITSVATASEDVIWVASRGEVSRLERRSIGWQRLPVPLGLQPDMFVRQISLDPQGSLWVGTDGQGLFRVSQVPARRVNPPSVLYAAQGMAPDGAAGVFVARACLEVDHIDRKGTSRRVALGFRHIGPNDIGCGVALARADADSAYVRLGRYLLRVSRTNPSAQLVSDGLPDDEGPIVVAADGTPWIASRQGVVHRLLAGGRVEQVATVPAPVVSAALAPDGTLWLGGDGTVARVRGPEVRVFGAEVLVPRGAVRDLLAEADGSVWIGAYGGGLGLLREGRVRPITTADGLPDNSISRILADGRGRLWISTNRGIAVANREELLALADGTASRIVPVVFGPERGVPEANFGSPAGFATSDGHLWFSTIEGPVVVDAARFPPNAAPPIVRFTRVAADDHPLPLDSPVAVPALTGRVRLDFSVPERLYPEALRFRFRVEGVDVAWVNVANVRTFSWTPPGPGRYRVLLEARSADGIWSPQPAVVVLDVLPAWWQRRMLRVIAACGLAIVVLGAFRSRIRRLKAHHAEQLRVVEAQRQAEAQVSTLRVQLEAVSRAALAGELAASLAHEVRQPLGAMVNNAEAGRRNLNRYLADPEDLDAILSDIVADGMRASEVIGGLRGLLRKDTGPPGPINLSALAHEILPLVRREFSDMRVALVLELAEDLPDVEGSRVQLGQVIVNLLLNACEALEHAPAPRRVTVCTQMRTGGVELSVRDSGTGPGPDIESRIFEPFTTTKVSGLGMGLTICRSIAEAHGGRLSAERPAGGGFAMTLSLPMAAPAREVL